MATRQDELFSSASTNPFPRIDPRRAPSKKIGTVAGAPTLAVGTPLAYDTTNLEFVPWTNGGANGTGQIRAFVYPDPVETSATEEVLATVMIEGEIHHADVVLPSGETQNNLDAALKAGLQAFGLTIKGLAGAY